MTNSEIRQIAKQNLKGKVGKAIGVTLLYGLLTYILSLILGFIPVIGALASSIISVPLAFGYLKQMILLFNGEQVGLVDFFRHAIENFGKVWCSSLWISLKLILPIILMIVGTVLAATDLAAIGTIVLIAAVVWAIVIGYKYCMINYTIAYDNTNLRARDLVQKSGEEAKGHIWKFLCMGIYYGLLMFAVMFIISFAIGLLAGLLGDIGAILAIPGYIVMIGIILYISILSAAALNEFYKINVLGGQQVAQSYDAPVDQPMYQENNYGYDVNSTDPNNGQSDDYFNNQQ